MDARGDCHEKAGVEPVLLVEFAVLATARREMLASRLGALTVEKSHQRAVSAACRSEAREE
jgi:hypothetical protein